LPMTEKKRKTEPQFAVRRIYTKDLSYEAPHAPEIFLWEGQPKHELNLNTKPAKLDDNTFEVVLSVTITTKVADKTAWIVEVHLAGVFELRGFSDAELNRVLGAFCPNLLFPYASEVVSNLVAKGGFPPFVLQPVNFDALFEQHQQQLADRNQRASSSIPH